MARSKGETKAPVAPAQDVDKAAEAAAASITAKHGAGSFIRLGSKEVISCAVQPTGIYQLDYFVLGPGGFPKGRIVEVYGPESSGKTTLALQLVAQAQKMGGKAAFIDVEHALDPAWARINGVNVDQVFISQPDYGEQALDITDSAIRSGAFAVVVVDSVAALTPKAELDGDFGDSNVGLHARLMSQAMRKLTSVVSQSKAVLLFVNQIREKVGVIYGSPEVTTGGKALKFYASVRLDIRKREAIKDGELVIGNKVHLKASKNKVAPPFREIDVDLLYDRGFDTVGSLFDAGVMNGAVQKAGAWYSFEDQRLGQGRDAAVRSLRSNESLYRQVFVRVVENDNKS